MNKKIHQYKSFWLLLLIISYLLTGFLYVPKIIQNQLKIQLKDKFQMQAELSKVVFNPITFSTDLRDFKLTDSKGIIWYQSQSIHINFDPLNLIWGEWKFSNLHLLSPQITLITDQSGKLITPDLPEISQPKNNTESFDFIIENIHFSEGQMNWQVEQSKGSFLLDIEHLNIEHEKLIFKDEDTLFAIKIITADQETLILDGHFNYARNSLNSQIEVQNWKAHTLIQVLPENFLLSKQRGTIDANGQIDWKLTNKPKLNFSSIHFKDINTIWNDTIHLNNLSATINHVNINAENETIHVESFISNQADWKIEWPIDFSAVSMTNDNENLHTIQESNWQFNINNIQINQWPVEFVDNLLSATISLMIDHLQLNSLNNKTDPFQLNAEIEMAQHGKLIIASENRINPYQIKSNITTTALPLAKISPWIAEQSDLKVTRGMINADQELIISDDGLALMGRLEFNDVTITNLDDQVMVNLGQLIIGSSKVSSLEKSITLDLVALDRANGDIISEIDKSLELINQTINNSSNNDSDYSKDWTIKINNISLKDINEATDDQSNVTDSVKSI